MRGYVLTGLVLAAAATASSAFADEPSVRIKDAVARVTVIPENRSDVKVEFITTNASVPLKVRQEGDKTIIEGNRGWARNYQCREVNGKISVKMAGLSRLDWENIPQLVVRTPMKADVSVGHAVWGSIGRSDSVEFANAGCGDWTIGNTRGELDISIAGSGDVKAGSAGELDLSVAGSGDSSIRNVNGKTSVAIAGSGDVDIGVANGPTELKVAGSGDTTIGSVNGPIDISVAGSGDVTIRGGQASKLDVSIAGSGNTTFDGVAGSLDASIVGSGDVSVRKVTGAVSRSVMGSGDVTIDGQTLARR